MISDETIAKIVNEVIRQMLYNEENTKIVSTKQYVIPLIETTEDFNREIERINKLKKETLINLG